MDGKREIDGIWKRSRRDVEQEGNIHTYKQQSGQSRHAEDSMGLWIIKRSSIYQIVMRKNVVGVVHQRPPVLQPIPYACNISEPESA